MAKRRPRLVLADDHPMLREGLRKLLEPGCEVIAEVADGYALLAVAERLRPDLVIADISMPGIDGLEATRRLKEILPGARVLVLSVHAETSWVRAAFAAGAGGYLTKTSASKEIELAVRALLQNRFYVSPLITRSVVASLPRGAAGERAEAARESGAKDSGELLTPRELDVVLLVGQGLGNKEIARQLGVKVPTVRTHLTRVYEKLGAASRVELALLAARTGAVM